MVVDEYAEVGFDFLVNMLSLAIGLWVMGSGRGASSVANALENFETKALPQSLIISLGSPWCCHTFSKNRWAEPSESTEVTVGIAWMHLDWQSTTTKIALFPWDSGSSVIMSTDIICYQWSGILFSIILLTFWGGKDFTQLQVSHPQMYQAMYPGSPGHQ